MDEADGQDQGGFTIRYVPEISGGGLKRPITLRHSRRVGDKTFAWVCKSSYQFERLVYNDIGENGPSDTDRRRRLTKTNIIERITIAKNEKYRKIYEAGGHVDDDKEDLGIDDTQSRKRRKSITSSPQPQMPETLKLDIDQCVVTALCTPPEDGLWLEMCNDTIEFLQRSVREQIEDGGVQRPVRADRDISKVSPVANVSYSHTRKAWRTKQRLSDGSSIEKYFRVKDNADDAREQAEQAALGGT